MAAFFAVHARTFLPPVPLPVFVSPYRTGPTKAARIRTGTSTTVSTSMAETIGSSPCLTPMVPQGGGASTSTRYVTYRELPKDYSGDAYYYNNRYYAGGRYEPGTYSYQGRTYDNRYFHNGQYIYGGDYRQSASVVSPQRYGERARSTYRNISR